MKALILVDSISDIPSKFRNSVLVINQTNWESIFLYLQGKKDSFHIFLHENTPQVRLLKVFEEYQGNLAVYTTANVDSIFLSRFTVIQNRRKITLKPLAEITENQKLLDLIKGFIK